jgi:hypothetical protein
MADSPVSTNKPGGDSSQPGAPANPQLAALKAESAITAEQLTIAQNRQKLLSTVLPSDVKPLEGSVKVDGDHPVESQILAYQTLDRLARTIANEIAEFKPVRVLIHADAEIGGVLGLEAFRNQLNIIQQEFEKDIGAAEPAINDAKAILRGEKLAGMAPLIETALVAGTLARSAIDLLSLFRTDVSLKYKDLTIADIALVAAVCGHLCRKNIAVYDPALLPPNPFGSTSKVVERINALTDLQGKIESLSADIASVQGELKQKIDELTAKIDEAAKLTPPRDDLHSKRDREVRQHAFDRLTAVGTAIATAVAGFAALKAALLKPDDESGQNALSKILRAEKFAGMAGQNPHLLFLKVAAAGGGYKIKQSKFGSGELLYSGGAIVEVILFDSTGRIVYAATLPAYSGFIKVNERSEKTANLQDVGV